MGLRIPPSKRSSAQKVVLRKYKKGKRQRAIANLNSREASNRPHSYPNITNSSQWVGETAPPASRPLRLVISYAKENRKQVEAIRKHLSTLIDEGKLELWYDNNLDGRTLWDAEIKERFYNADAFLVLISDDYIDRERKTYIHKVEVPIMHERHSKLGVPVYCITVVPVDCGQVLDSFYHFDKKNPMPTRGNAQGAFLLRFVNEVIKGKLLGGR